ncbi:MAG: dTDP-4-dehydrorhamnose reductase [Gammaproteobacteria bacterium]
MKILTTGGNGQLGWELQRYSEVTGYTREMLDITQPASIEKIFTLFQPDIVINAAAYTAVDKAETETDLAFKINRDGAENLAKACNRIDVPLVHISTDYIFDGKKSTPYTEDHMPYPLGVYGKSKWDGEERVRMHCPKHIILRVSGVFSQHGHNFVKTILRIAREREGFRIVADQIICPTPAADIATAILDMVKQPLKYGTYHYCSNEPTTWYDFTKAIVAYAGLKKEIQPITTADYPLPAQRPHYSVLDTHKMYAQYGIQTKSWRSGLSEVIKNVQAA